MAYRVRNHEHFKTATYSHWGASPPPVPAPPPRSVLGFHGAVSAFKRHLIEATLHRVGGIRTRAARAPGLQRTYLLRLIRDRGVSAPPAPQLRRILSAG
jgi:DNA-binding NtrC family response regulator